METLLIICFLICLHIKVSRGTEILIDGRMLTILEAPTRRIIQGWSASAGDVPYMVSFKKKRSPTLYGSFCGGALIAPQKILTAVHCFYKRNVRRSFTKSTNYNKGYKKHVNNLEPFYAVMGSFLNTDKYAPDENGVGQWRALQKFNYLKTHTKVRLNDLGLVFTVRNFDINDAVRPVPYATRRENYIGTCSICGFGAVKPHSTSSVLMLGHVHLVDDIECNQILRSTVEHVICGSLDWSYIGRGDSGGPLVCKGTEDEREDPELGILVGVSSGFIRGKSCMFTRVSSFAPFIESMTALNSKAMFIKKPKKAPKRPNEGTMARASSSVLVLLENIFGFVISRFYWLSYFDPPYVVR